MRSIIMPADEIPDDKDAGDVLSDPIDHPAATGRAAWRRPLAWLLAGALLGVSLTAVIILPRRGSPVAEVHVDTGPAPSSGSAAVPVASKLGPSVGTVVASLANNRYGEGSGFVVAHGQGVSYLETNNHVVNGALALHVAMPNGRSLTATLVGADRLDDLAVLSVPIADLPVATFGDSSVLTVGQSVVAIGSPLGNTGSVTTGVISALHRTVQAGAQGGTETETLQDVLQTDASINLGNSGGPLADLQARVVGVNVALETTNGSTNIGYSIPGNVALTVAKQLIAHEKVDHPYLGIAYQTSVQALEAGHGFDGSGVYVNTVQTGGPAAAAGFQVGDVLVAVNGNNIDNGQTLGGLLQGARVGDSVRCTVKRGPQTLTLNATLIERPQPPTTPAATP